MEITVLAAEPVPRLVLGGELDLATAHELPEAAAAAAGRGGLVIDLRQLRFIDSTGLRALILVHRECEAGGRRLRLIPGPEAVQRLFELTGVDKLLEFVTAPDGDGVTSAQAASAPPDAGPLPG
jgi:anti-anti-sigma factor